MIPILIVLAFLSGVPTSFDAIGGYPTLTGPVGTPSGPQSADAIGGYPTLNGPH